MQVSYSRRWNLVLHRPLDPVDEARARQLDAGGDYYTVAFHDGGGYVAYLQVNWAQRHLQVYFLEDAYRPWLSYTFTRVDDTTLFLSNVTRWEYPDATALAMSGATVVEELQYQPDGSVLRIRTDDVAHERVRQRVADVPLDINWEPVPRFGAWDPLLVIERQPTR